MREEGEDGMDLGGKLSTSNECEKRGRSELRRQGSEEKEKAEPSRGNDEGSYLISLEGDRSTEDFLDDGNDKGERLARTRHSLTDRWEGRLQLELEHKEGGRERRTLTSTTTSRFPMKSGITLAWTGVIWSKWSSRMRSALGGRKGSKEEGVKLTVQA